MWSIFSQAFLAINLVSFHSGHEAGELRLECDDVRSLSESALGTYEGTQEFFSRARELAIQSMNGTIAAVDRGFIAEEYNAITDEIERNFRLARWQDSHGEQYHYLSEGMEFQTRVKSSIGDGYFVVGLGLPKIDSRKLGSLAVERVYLTQLDQDEPSGQLYIDKTAIRAPNANDDTLSSVANRSSAIAIGRVINERTSATGVEAAVLPNKVRMGLGHLDRFPELAGYILSINGVRISSREPILSFQELADEINDGMYQSGVTVSVFGHEETGFGLVFEAEDGRNIHLAWGSDAYESLDLWRRYERSIVQISSLRLVSSRSFKLKPIDYAHFLFLNEAKTVERGDFNLFASEISTPDKARDSLLTIDSALSEWHRLYVAIDRLNRYCGEGEE